MMMRYWIFALSSMLLLIGCASTTSTSDNDVTPPTVFEDRYYQDLKKNITRLHHLMQGTFTAYGQEEDNHLKAWTVSEGDSVILYNVALGDVAKHGYWILSYEFMTSLPDQPIYTSIKQLVQVERDTVDVYYYQTNQPLNLTLADVLDKERLTASIDWEQLQKRNKRVRYARRSSSNFVGSSLIYTDPDRDCLRRNSYNLSPLFYHVDVIFYDKQTTAIRSDIKNRPNLLVRRAIEQDVLRAIAGKS